MTAPTTIVPPTVRPTALEQQLATYGGRPDEPRFAIDPRDEMLEFLVGVHPDAEQARCGYFRSGQSIADVLGQVLAWRFGAAGTPVVLDFASGYGRVTRFLLDAVPASRLWVSDILGEAVAAQRAAFGVQGFVSALGPEELAAPRSFDAITVTSLFTHLPEERFHSWLAALWRLVAPGGALLFSTHDSALHPAVEKRDARFAFERTSESRSLSLDDYGTTWVSEDFVRSAIARACGGASALRLPRALCNFQDLWVVLPEAGASFASLALHGEPELMVDQISFEGGELALEGWAIARHGGVARVEITLDGTVVGSAAVEGARGDIAAVFGPQFHTSGWGWRGELPPGTTAGDAVVGLRVVDARGKAFLFWVGSLQLLQVLVHRLQARAFREQLTAARAELAAHRAAAAAEIAGLRGRLAAMESSRFWKLRNSWFAVKRALRLTEES
jgi:SAM-dependent methyltransferase